MHDLNNISIQYAKKVGPKLAKKFNKLGVYTLLDLFYYFPRDILDRRLVFIKDLHSLEYACIKAFVKSIKVEKKGRLTIIKALLQDKTGYITAVWFNQLYIKKKLKISKEYCFCGKLDKKYSVFQLLSPEVYPVEDNIHCNRFLPIYPLTEGITNNYITTTIYTNLHQHLDKFEEYLPQYLLEKYNLLDIKKALYNIHFPRNLDLFNKSRERFLFEELFIFQLYLAYRKQKIKSKKGISFKIEDKLFNYFQDKLPFNLTNAQRKVIHEIIRDMSSDKVMHRLIQGDVGSGKTIVTIFAALVSVLNGFQVVLMAPTEVLAKQHFNTYFKFLSLFKERKDIKIALLVGSMKAKEKNKVLKQIKDFDVDIVIGTHALIQSNVEFNKLGLVIIDEQHKFGVHQRAALISKSVMPDILVMSATPIPRTLALSLYGDLDISVIDELPKGRKEIKTYWSSYKYEDKVYNFALKQIKEGRQIYIVFPLIEESEKLKLYDLQNHSQYLIDKFFKDIPVAVLHGKMSASEKDEVMRLFKEGVYKVLISTTVIEVGIDVENANLIIINNAERFGLSQLHQLRGRVGRGKWQSYCILLTNTYSQDIAKRLKVFVSTNDGFKIAQADLLIRGPGQFLGDRQHGKFSFKFADLLRDVKILKIARDEANYFLQKGYKIDDFKFIKDRISLELWDKLD